MNLKERFEQLEEREKKLLMVFAGVVGVIVVLILPFALAVSVSSKSAANERIREIIQQIEDERAVLARRQADGERVERRYARQAPPLAGFLAQIADKAGVEIPETQDRSTVPRGKTFKERITKIQLRKVGMLQLSNFMDKVSNSGYAVSISKLNIKKRGTKPDEFDAEMEISAFDHEKPKKKPDVSEGEDSGDGEGEED